QAEQGPVVGPVPLTPVQRWFFETHPERPEYFHQTLTLDLAGNVDEAALRTAFASVLAHHDALRMRYSIVDGVWQQENRPVTAEDVFAGGPTSLSGGLLRAELLDGGRALRITAHHLVVDVVSRLILLADLDTAYRQARSGRAVHLGAKTTSFQE